MSQEKNEQEQVFWNKRYKEHLKMFDHSAVTLPAGTTARMAATINADLDLLKYRQNIWAEHNRDRIYTELVAAFDRDFSESIADSFINDQLVDKEILIADLIALSKVLDGIAGNIQRHPENWK